MFIRSLASTSSSSSKKLNSTHLLAAIRLLSTKISQNHSVKGLQSSVSAKSLTSLSSKSSSFSSILFSRSFALESVKVPSLGDSISEGTLVKWQKNVGDSVERDEVLVVIETDKVSVDIRSPTAGIVKSQAAKEGETVKVGADLGVVDTEGKAAAPAAKSSSASSDNVKQAQPAQSSAAAPKDSPAPAPKATSGTQPQPSSNTVPAFNNQPTKPTSTSSSSAPAPKPSTNASAPTQYPSGVRSERRVPMTRMRQTIANRLKHAQNTAASLTTFNEIDMSNLMELRNKHKDEFVEKHGVKLGFMSGFVKAASIALQKYPDVNAYIDGNDLVYHDFVDISVAVSTPTGLVVPVLRNCEQMNFHQIESAINSLGQKARKNQIAIEDMMGGTFTISNGGVYGSLFGTPILNPPQAAILGMHGIFKRPVVIGDKIEIRPMMYVALTYDHRIIDGGGAVTFLKEIKSNIEDPSRLLLNL